MSKISRRHFLYGSLLAGVVPRAGFGSAPSLRLLGYQSPNEKLNICVSSSSSFARGNAKSNDSGIGPKYLM